MIKKIVQLVRFIKEINFFQYLYLNFFCKSIIRIDQSKLIPYKNSIIDIASDARIYIGGGDVEIGCNLLRRSKEETRLRMRESALWSIYGGCKISYGSTIEILKNAFFDCKYFTMNSDSTVIVAEKIVFGKDVMIGRNVVIYDSDHHQMIDEGGRVINPPNPVVIGNHVWLGTNVLILKGVTIGDGSVVGANSIVSKRVESYVIYSNEYKSRVKENSGKWDRRAPNGER